MVVQAPLGHDRAAARDNAGGAFSRQRHVVQPHARVDGEIVDALFGLLNQCVAEHRPAQVLGDAIDLFQRLINRHSADRDRRVADDPLTDIVDVPAGGQVHYRIAAPADRPHHLVDFVGHRGCDSRIADVGVDLDEEIAPDDHRLRFWVVDIGRNNGPPPGDLVTDEFRCDEIGNRRTETVAVTFDPVTQLRASEIFADGNKLHFPCDLAGPGIGQLGDRLVADGPQGLMT